ncbi:MAG: histidinol dehydrogenase, partial [Victivallales bacterium]|nr:histidinol dehydrogenase [Victivallales bacterium]
RRMSVVKYDRPALMRDLPYIKTFARNEGLDAHGNSAAIRETR